MAALARRNSLKTVVGVVLFLALTGYVAFLSVSRSLSELGWPDGWMYLTLARNLVEGGSFDTTFYLGSSIEAIGYPHRDVHLPGYVLTIAGVGSLAGTTFNTAVAINVACFFISVLSTFVLARRFLSIERAFVAASLVALMPPY